MTHLVQYVNVETINPATGKKVIESRAERKGRSYLTRCGKWVHQKWALLSSATPAQCHRCSPTMKGMMNDITALPREIVKLRRALKVA